ncbi:imidazole glycerol phosphate synthase subunit HisF [Hwanghaeella grinnelliae]|nr:imidazole glycerol phosphate synthase cyclase subunit [Hwanghaeella grinnelliae]
MRELCRIIPSMLLSKNRLVKGTRYAEYRDAGSAKTTARAYNAQGADEIFLLDIDASKENREPDFETIAAAALECFVPLTVGGGISSLDIADRCFKSGADKICLTSTARSNPALIDGIAHRYGSQATVIGIDVWNEDGTYLLYDHLTGRPTRDLSLEDWLDQVIDLGAGELRVMDVSREGTREGLNTDLYDKVRTRVSVPVILEGGAGTLSQVAEALSAGVDAVALGTLLVFSDNNIRKIKHYMRHEKLPVRL